MKKIGITLCGILLNICATAQIGINITEPKATLDIIAKKGITPDGLLVPRLTATEVQAMDTKIKNEQNSLLVYVTQTFTTVPTTGKCVNIDSEGYYYYDHKNGEVWRKLGSEAYSAGAGIKISNGVVSATGLESISKTSYNPSDSSLPNPYYGWRLIGRDETKYEEPGYAAVDLSFNTDETKKTGALGNFSTAIGYKTTASGTVSFATGSKTIASGDYSTAMGLETTAKADYSVAIGKYNVPTEENIFSVGIGRGVPPPPHPPFIDHRNAFVIDKETGQVAINKTRADRNGDAQLQVNGLIQSEDIYYSNSDKGRMVIANSDGVLKTGEFYFEHLKNLYRERFVYNPNVSQPGRTRITGTNGYWFKEGDKWKYYGTVIIVGSLEGDDLTNITLKGYNHKAIGNMGNLFSNSAIPSYIVSWDSDGDNNTLSGGKATSAGVNEVDRIIRYTGSNLNVIGLVGFWGAYWNDLPLDTGLADYDSGAGGTRVLCVPIRQLYKYEE